MASFNDFDWSVNGDDLIAELFPELFPADPISAGSSLPADQQPFPADPLLADLWQRWVDGEQCLAALADQRPLPDFSSLAGQQQHQQLPAADYFSAAQQTSSADPNSANRFGGLFTPPGPAATTSSSSSSSVPAPNKPRGRGRPRKAEEDKVKPTRYHCRFCVPATTRRAGYQSTEGLLHHMAEAHQLFPAQSHGRLHECVGCNKKFLRPADLHKHRRAQGIHKKWRHKAAFQYAAPTTLEEIGDTFGPKYGPMSHSLIVGQEHLPGRTERKPGCLW